MGNQRIEKTEGFLKEMLSRSAHFKKHPEAMEYRIEHSYRTANIGKEIALAEGLDAERMIIACLLHDLGYYYDFEKKDDYANHGRIGAAAARPFLKGLGYSDSETEEICYAIAIHVDGVSDFEFERTVFAMTVGDADNIDRFDAFRIYDVLAKAHFWDMKLGEKTDFVNARLELMEKMKKTNCATETAEKMWQDRLDFQTEYFTRLKRQLASSQWWSIHGK
ncbi:MAG: HD domain-containing protein [Firmicutes bacterium]|nr:HD domain-containing protein [Bacillota bacterium]